MTLEVFPATLQRETSREILRYQHPYSDSRDAFYFTPQEAEILAEGDRFRLLDISGNSILQTISINPLTQIEVDPLIASQFPQVLERSGEPRQVAVFVLRYMEGSFEASFVEQVTHLDDVNDRLKKPFKKFGQFSLLEPREALEVAIRYQTLHDQPFFANLPLSFVVKDYWETITRGLVTGSDGEKYQITVGGVRLGEKENKLLVRAQIMDQAAHPLTGIASTFVPKL